MVAESRKVKTSKEDVVLVLWNLPNSLCFLSTCREISPQVYRNESWGGLNRDWNLNLCSKGKQKWRWMENSGALFLQRKATARCPAGERPPLTSRILTLFHLPVHCLVTSPSDIPGVPTKCYHWCCCVRAVSCSSQLFLWWWQIESWKGIGS